MRSSMWQQLEIVSHGMVTIHLCRILPFLFAAAESTLRGFCAFYLRVV